MNAPFSTTQSDAEVIAYEDALEAAEAERLEAIHERMYRWECRTGKNYHGDAEDFVMEFGA